MIKDNLKEYLKENLENHIIDDEGMYLNDLSNNDYLVHLESFIIKPLFQDVLVDHPDQSLLDSAILLSNNGLLDSNIMEIIEIIKTYKKLNNSIKKLKEKY